MQWLEETFVEKGIDFIVEIQNGTSKSNEIKQQYLDIADGLKEVDNSHSEMFKFQYELLRTDVEEDFFNTLDVLACVLDTKNYNIIVELKQNFLRLRNILYNLSDSKNGIADREKYR